MPLTKGTIFDCKCGNSWAARSKTRATCPKCGAFCRTKVSHELLNSINDPRLTLSKCQEALEKIVERAGNQEADNIDVMMAKVLMDGMKYLTPALEASMVQNTNDDTLLEKLLGSDDAGTTPQLRHHAPEALPPRPRSTLIDISEI